MITTIFCDGGTRGSVICIHDPQINRSFVKKRNGVQGNTLTNNELEYLAVIYAIEYCNNNYSRKKVLLVSDSQLIVNHINGKYKCNPPNLKKLLEKVKKKMKFGDRIIWVPREKNLAGHHLEKFY